jgi:hypothetical protein
LRRNGLSVKPRNSAGLAIDRQVEVERMVLAELEALEAVEAEDRALPELVEEVLVQQQTVPSEAVELHVDGVRGDAEVVGGLAVGHAAGGLGHQLGEDIRPFQVVGDREGL